MKKIIIKRKRITHFGKYSSLFYGGIENVVRNSINSSTFSEYDLFSITFCKQDKTIYHNCFTEYTHKPLFTFFSQPFSLSYINRCISIGNKSDIIHFHFPNIISIISLLYIKKSVKVLLHWHSDIVNQKFLSLLLFPLQYFLIKRANLIVCTSQNYFNHSNILRQFSNKVFILPIGIPDPSIHQIHKQTTNNDLPFDSKSKIILSVGRLVHYKGFTHLIRAFKESNIDSILVIVGNGPLYKKLIYLIKNENLQNSVFILTNVNEFTLNYLFRRASFFCLSSLNKSEAFGIVLLEALAFGLPLITYNLKKSGVSWVNMNNYCGFQVEVNNINSFALAIREVTLNKQLRDLFSRNARSRYLSEFTLPVYNNKLNQLYKELLQS